MAGGGPRRSIPSHGTSSGAARALALRILKEGGATDADRLTYGFRLTLSRRPAGAERDVLLSLLHKQQSRLAEGWLGVREITGLTTEAKPELPAGVTPAQWAAWTALSRVLLNLDETITRE